MELRRVLRTSSILAIAAITLHCAARAKVSRIEALGETGRKYAETVNELVENAERVLVDANSLEMLMNRQDAAVSAEELKKLTEEEREKWRDDRFDQLEAQDQALKSNLREYRLIRRQLSLLEHYFETLTDLASSSAPEAFAAEIGNTIPALNGLSDKLKSTKLFNKPKSQQKIVGGIGELVVRHVQLGELEKELEERKEVIAEILLVHEALFDALAAQVENDLTLKQQQQYEEQVADPYADITKALSETDKKWIEKRGELLSVSPLTVAVREAGDAAIDLRAAWIKALSDDVAPGDFLAVLEQLEPILAGLEEMRETKDEED